MSKEISKSPEMIEKEARIEILKKDIKKQRTTLKRLKTRLKNTKQEITDIQRTVTSAYMRMMDKMMQLKAEITESLKRLRKLKNISKDEKKEIDFFIKDLNDVSEDEDFENYEEYKRKMEEGDFDFDKETRAKMRDMFQEFQVKPDEKEQRNIRKVFIKLSTNFHPDKAKNKKQAEDYHVLMQQINEAYQSGDIDKLLEIEQMYLGAETIDLSTQAVTVDILEQVINRLERDLGFIKNQISRTSDEIKQLRSSDLGSMLTDINRAEKFGMGVDGMTAEMDENVSKLEELRDIFQECEKQKSLSPMHNMVMQQGLMQDDMFDLFGDDDDEEIDFEDVLENLMGNFSNFFDERTPVKNPKFKIGTSVCVSKNIFHGEARSTNIKGWEGRVVDVYKEANTAYYEIQFDSITIKAMNKDFIEILIDEGEEFETAILRTGDLKKSTPRDTPEEMMAAYRTVLHSIRWNYLDDDDHAKMQEILLRFPEKSDQENWGFWLENNLQFPFKAKHKGFYNDKKNKKTDVIRLYSWHEEVGQLVLIKSGKSVRDHPLVDLKTDDDNAPLLRLYTEYTNMS